MIAARDLLLSLFVVMVSSASGWAAGVKAKAEVSCAATAKPLEYDCTIKLSDARSGAALTGVEVTVGADMPSMPMAHNVKPVKAMPGSEPGTYRAQHQAGDARRLGRQGRSRRPRQGPHRQVHAVRAETVTAPGLNRKE